MQIAVVSLLKRLAGDDDEGKIGFELMFVPPINLAQPTAGVVAGDGGAEGARGDDAEASSRFAGFDGVDDDEAADNAAALCAQRGEFAAVTQMLGARECFAARDHGGQERLRQV